jgi:hypothetical protein
MASVYLMTEISKQRIKMSQISAGAMNTPYKSRAALSDPIRIKLTYFDFLRFVDDR